MVTEKTIAEMANLWKEEKRQFVKKSTYAAYSLIVETHILPAFGDLTTVTEKDVQEFVLQKLQSGLWVQGFQSRFAPCSHKYMRCIKGIAPKPLTVRTCSGKCCFVRFDITDVNGSLLTCSHNMASVGINAIPIMPLCEKHSRL